MPKDNLSSNTGNAQIMRQGHTATGAHGDDPNLRAQFNQRSVRDLKPKS